MNLGDLLKDIDERTEEVGLAIDADSLLYLSAYTYRNKWDIELAYFEFAGRVKTIERECYKKALHLKDTVLCFTAKTNFRYELYPSYKAHRSSTDEEQNLLKQRVVELKKLVYDRAKAMCKASNIVEADDLVIMYANKGYLVSAIDKDVVNQCPTDCFNFKKYEWNEGLNEETIKKNILIQSIMGDSSDGFNFVNGYGKVKATKFIDDLLAGRYSMDEYINLFATPEDCLLSNRLCNMHQYKDNKLTLVTMQDIFDMVSPF